MTALLSQTRRRETAEWLACMLVASAGLLYALWVVPYIPMQDGPHHLLSAHIENHYSDPGSLYPPYYRVLPQFAGKGFSMLYAPLESVMPWRLALRITLSFIALAFAWGFALVVLALDRDRDRGRDLDRARDRDRRPLALLGFLIALPWTLYMGMFPFCVGSAVGLYTLAFVLHRPPRTTGRRALLALFLLVQGALHIFTALLTGIIVTVVVVAGAPKGQRLRETGRMALVGVPAAGLLALTFLERKLDSTAQQETLWALAERAGEVSRWFVPGTGGRAWIVIGLMVVGIAATLTRARRGTATPAEQGLAWLALAFVFASVLLPLHIRGWQFFAPRFAFVATALGLALVRVPSFASPLARRAIAPVLALCTVGSSLLSAHLHRDLARGCADPLAAVDAPLHFSGARLPVVVDAFCGLPSDPAASPIPRAGMAATMTLVQLIDHGGMVPTLFNGSPAIHAVELRADAPIPPPPDPLMETLSRSHWFQTDPKFRASVLTELAGEGMPFEGIHVVGGRPEDAAVFVSRGYVTEFLRGSMLIARFEGCAAELLLPAGALDREPVYYEYGLFTPAGLTPEPRVVARRSIDRATAPTGDAIHVPLAGRPCGEIWLRVVWDADGSSTLTPGDRSCKSAGRGGRLLATVDRDHPTVLCAPSP